MDNFQQEICELVDTLGLDTARSLLRHLERDVKLYQEEATELAEKIDGYIDDLSHGRIVDLKLASTLLHLQVGRATEATAMAERAARDLNLGLEVAKTRGQRIKAMRKALEEKPPQYMAIG